MLQSQNGPEEWISASDGIEAAAVNTVWHEGLVREIQATADLRCKVQLAGDSHFVFDNRFEESPSGARLMFLHEPCGAMKREQVGPGVRERSITLAFPIQEDSLAGCGREDPAVDRALAAMGQDIQFRQGAVPRAIGRLVAAILDSDRCGRQFDKRRRTAIDELSCLVLDAFLDGYAEQAPVALTGRESRQVWDAHHLLVSDLSAAPSLARLASAVGSNRTKLNQGFRAIFGLSPYKLLHQERMAEAYRLLEVGELEIGEVSARCGYDYVSNFSLAFKAFHGRSPTEVRRSGPRGSSPFADPAK